MRFIDQVESWEVITFIVCALIFAVYFGQKIDFENLLKKDSATPVHIGGKIGSKSKLPGVEVLNIPDTVYASLDRDTQFKRYLTGNHKYVFLFTYPGCPYARAFSDAFKRLFEQDGFDQYYRKRVQNVGRTTTVSCPGHRDMNCATAWVYQHCFGGLCIFNPVRRQLVVDKSQNAKQIEALLTTYKDW